MLGNVCLQIGNKKKSQEKVILRNESMKKMSVNVRN